MNPNSPANFVPLKPTPASSARLRSLVPMAVVVGVALFCAGTGAGAQDVLLNEIYVNPPGNTLPHEFIELKGPPLAALDGYFLVAINGNPGVAGRADLVLNLDGVLLGTNGLLVVKVSAETGFIVPRETRVVAEPRLIDTAVSPLNNNSLSVLLVRSVTPPAETVDYDSNNDGVFDVAPLDTATIVDAIGIRQLIGDPVYGGARVPNVGNDNRPEAIARLDGDTRARNADAWFGARMNGSGLTVEFNAQVTPNFLPGATLTPGRDNVVFTAFRIEQSGGTTDVDEDGVMDMYTFALATAPAAGRVVITVSADSQLQLSINGEAYVSQLDLVFTPEDATSPRIITVRAVDDAVAEAGHVHPGVINHAVTATDDPGAFPLTLPAVKVTVNIFDNDSLFPIVQATRETAAAFDPSDSDDPAVWIHPSDPARNLLLTTRKFGGAAILDFDLVVRQSIVPATNGALRLNNVDVLYGFSLGGVPTDLAVFSDRVSDTLLIYRIDPEAAASPLTEVTAARGGPIFAGSTPGGDTAYGLCLYRSPLDRRAYAFVSRNGLSQIAQLELIDAGEGRVGWRLVRTIALPDPRQVEGMVADQELGSVYLAQEKVGLWKFPAEPSRASDGGVLLQRVKPNGTILAADVEGLCLYYSTNGTGYLLASGQGENTFAIFSRDHTNEYLGSFVVGANRALGIDQVTTSDGGEVISVAVPNFPQGVFIVHDGENDGSIAVKNTNFKLVPWEAVAGTTSPNLRITPAGFDPRTPVNRLPARLDHISWAGDEVRLQLSGPAGLTFDLEVSGDLSVWRPLQRIEFTSPSMEVSDRSPLPTARFYRLTSVPAVVR